MSFKIISPASLEDIAYVMRRVFGEDFEVRFERPLAEVLGASANLPLSGHVEDGAIGSIILHTDPNLLYGLGVVDEHRKQGYASRLIDEALAEAARKAPYDPVFTAVEKTSIWVREGYEKRGFRVIHEDVIPGHLLLMRDGLTRDSDAD